MRSYDLQKAFDTVEYPMLLKRLYKAGVNGKPDMETSKKIGTWEVQEELMDGYQMSSQYREG